MINEYIREYKIGSGSYGKVVSVVFMVPNYLSSPNDDNFPEPLSYIHYRLFIEALSMESIMQSR